MEVGFDGRPAANDSDDMRTELKRPTSSTLDLNPEDFDPALLSEMDEEQTCCDTDGSLERCCSHCWFLMTCLTCYVYSALLRLVVVIDLAITLVFFLRHISNEDFVKAEITDYNFSKSAIFVMILSTVRNFLLFFCYAYKYQTYHSTFITATSLTAFSVIFLSIKLVFCIGESHTALDITLASLIMSLSSYFLYGIVRRRRIYVPPRRKEYRHDYEKLSETDTSAVDVDVEAPEPRERLKSFPEGMNPVTLSESYSRFVDMDGVSVHYRHHKADDRKKSKPAIVLLHGFGGSVFSWKKIWPMLRKDSGRDLLAFDLPGFGLTSRPIEDAWEHNPYTQQFSLMLLFKLMDYLRIKKATFLGHGSGGALALLAAAMRPKRVETVVLVSPAIYTSGFPTFLRSLFRTRLGKSIVTDLVRSEMGELLLRRSYHDKKRLSPDVLQTYKNLLKVTNWDSALLEMTRVPPTVKVETKVSLVECPIAIIHGLNDKLIPITESKRLLLSLERHGQRGDLVVIDQCGHVPHEEKPEEFADVVLECLKNFGSPIETISE